jgi:hypothetical protein
LASHHIRRHPTRDELERLTLDLLKRGINNSDQMRDAIRRERKLILSNTITPDWNSTPSNKFVNEHAHVLSLLVKRQVIVPIETKTYRFV